MWNYPTIWYHYFLFATGVVLFWLLIPLWIVLCKLWFKRDSAFIMYNIQAIFYNPWLMWS